MSSRERVGRVRMQRIALVAPRDAMRATLVEAADAGVVDLDRVPAPSDRAPGPAAKELERRGGLDANVVPLIAPEPLGDDLVSTDAQVLAGEAELERRIAAALPHGRVAALLGWAPARVLTDFTRGSSRAAAPRSLWFRPRVSTHRRCSRPTAAARPFACSSTPTAQSATPTSTRRRSRRSRSP